LVHSNKKRGKGKALEALEEILREPVRPNSSYADYWIRSLPKSKGWRKVKRISKNTAYKKGRAFEYRVKKHFEKLGYYVKRSYASKGAEDLLAIKKIIVPSNKISVSKSKGIEGIAICSEVLLIQCKNLKVERKLSKKECDNLRILSKITGGTPMVAMNVDHKLKIEEIDL